MAGGQTTGWSPTSSLSPDAPYFRIERDVLTLLHYFGPLTLDAVRGEFSLSYNRVEFILQSLQCSGYATEQEDGRFMSTGRWDPES